MSIDFVGAGSKTPNEREILEESLIQIRGEIAIARGQLDFVNKQIRQLEATARALENAIKIVGDAPAPPVEA